MGFTRKPELETFAVRGYRLSRSRTFRDVAANRRVRPSSTTLRRSDT
jgi:hypothetical protein